MSEILVFKKKLTYSKTVIKVVDGVEIEAINVDELPSAEQYKYFSNLSRRASASLDEAEVKILLFNRPSS